MGNVCGEFLWGESIHSLLFHINRYCRLARLCPLDTLHRWPLQAVQKALPAAVLVTAVFRSLLPKPRATLRRATLRLATSYSATSNLPPRSGIDGTELLMLPGRAPHGERHDERHDERRSERSTAHALYR